METRLGTRQRRRPPAVHRGSTHAPRLQRPVASEYEASACSELRLGCHPETPVIEPCPERAWFKNARFRVTLGISARTLIGPARCSGFTRVPGCRAGASVPREPRVPQKFQPVSVRLTRQQLRGALADPTGVFTAQVPAVIQEELKQRQVVLPQLPPQEEVAAQPAIEVLDQTAGPHNPIGELLHRGADAVITPS